MTQTGITMVMVNPYNGRGCFKECEGVCVCVHVSLFLSLSLALSLCVCACVCVCGMDLSSTKLKFSYYIIGLSRLTSISGVLGFLG